MLISHWHPLDARNSWPFPFIENNLHWAASSKWAWREKISYFFINHFDISNLNGVLEVSTPSISSSISETLVFHYIKQLVSDHINQTRIGLTSFYTMSFTTSSCSKHKYRDIYSLCQSSKIWRKSLIENPCHVHVWSKYFIALEFLLNFKNYLSSI